MKHHILGVLTVLLLIITVSVFALEASTPALPSFQWERNVASHWKLNDNGEPVNQEPHTLNELMCTVCGCEILDWGDGSADVTDYDEYGNATRYSSFDAAGMLVSESIHAYEYDESGVVLVDYEFIGGVFYCKYIYTVNEYGEQIPVSATSCNDDGTSSVNTYDEHGNLVHAAIYEADGSVTFETITEYALDDEGWYYEARITSRFADGASFYTENNQYGDPLRTLNTEADGTIWADHTYEYGYAEGVMLWSKQYDQGRLAEECQYNEFGQCVKETSFTEDGSAEIWLYNENGDVDSVTCLAPDGSITLEETYAYEYAEDMSTLSCKAYRGDALVRQTEYLYDDDMNMLGSVETTWNEDGSITVAEYDGFFDLIQETTFTPEEYAAQ